MLLKNTEISEGQQGNLFIVATPIGNMEDITLRALKVLSSVSIILAEDTRLTGRLLHHYDIKSRLLSMNEHNEIMRTNEIITEINSCANVALVSSAGTPLISDPGFRLICKAIKAAINIVPIPGVSAVVSSLSVSGLPTNSFVFLGFPARKKGKRLDQLRQLVFINKTLIFYESPKRILTFIHDIIEILGDRDIVLSREMTKIHEEFIRGKASIVLNKLKDRKEVRGECTLLVSGTCSNDRVVKKRDIITAIKKHLVCNSTTTSDLSKTISKLHGLSKKDVYSMILEVKKTLEIK